LVVAVILLLLLFFSSCEKLLNIDSQHLVNQENKWKDINDARASLMGIYGLVRSALAESNGHWIYGDIRQGPFVSDARRDLQEIIDGRLNSSSPLLTQLSNWRKFYAAINAANLFIENSEKIVANDRQYTESNWRIDIAQARALKGFCYFLLARIWGDAPIWDKAYESSFPTMKQSTQEEVLSYAENELKSALKILPFRYGSISDEVYPVERYHGSDFTKWDGVLFNRLSVNAILAHLTAWSGKYMESSVYSNFVLTNASKAVATYVNSSSLTTSDGFFYTSSNSQIVAFPFKWSAMESSFEGHIEQLTLASPLVSKQTPDLYIPSSTIVGIFQERGDQRFNVSATGEVSTLYFSEFGSIRPLFSKIKVIRGGGADGSFPLFSSAIVFSRLEDMALLRAEALYVLGDYDVARTLLNQVRVARNLNSADANKNLLDEIFLERNKELMGEGHFWFDLVRYYKIKGDDLAFNKLIHNKGIFWPIAKEVLAGNPSLKQNPYWN